MAKHIEVSIDMELYKTLQELEEAEGIGVEALLRIAIHNLDTDWKVIKPKYLNVDGKTEPLLSKKLQQS